MPEHTDYLTRDEFAALAGVHRRTVEQWGAQGIGPRPVRHGPRLIRYRRADALAWLAEGEPETAGSIGGPARARPGGGGHAA
jgi:predicted DNA-binding transcriptional regulator AlpA